MFLLDQAADGGAFDFLARKRGLDGAQGRARAAQIDPRHIQESGLDIGDSLDVSSGQIEVQGEAAEVELDRQLAQLSQGSQVDDELAKMKAELGTGGAPAPKQLEGEEAT